jgi:hypothetical protein
MKKKELMDVLKWEHELGYVSGQIRERQRVINELKKIPWLYEAVRKDLENILFAAKTV